MVAAVKKNNKYTKLWDFKKYRKKKWHNLSGTWLSIEHTRATFYRSIGVNPMAVLDVKILGLLSSHALL